MNEKYLYVRKLHIGNYKLFYRVIFLVFLEKSVIFIYHTENVNVYTEGNDSITKVSGNVFLVIFTLN